jgi:hypothetical protein
MRNPSPVPYLASKPGEAQRVLAAAKYATRALEEEPSPLGTRSGVPNTSRMAGQAMGLDPEGFGRYVRDPQGYAEVEDWLKGPVGLANGPYNPMAGMDQQQSQGAA